MTMKGFMYTDGGARGNPGPAATGIIIKNEDRKIISRAGAYLGVATNNEAEYIALIQGLTLAEEKGFDELSCLLDSELVVNQLNGVYKVKNERIKVYFGQVRDLSKKFKFVSFTHIVRSQNKEADAIVNKVLDEHAKK